MSKKRKFVEIQDDKIRKSGKDASHTEQSQYWDDFNRRSSDQEHVLANPDSLPDKPAATPSTPQLIMGEAIEHLQGRQREIYLLTMRDDKSLGEAAEILGIEKATAQTYKDRAIKFIEKYCKEAIAKGRV